MKKFFFIALLCGLTGMAYAERLQVDMTFSFAPISGGVTVTPSNNNDKWDFAIVTATQYASVENDADFIAEYFYSENGDDYAVSGAHDIIYSENGVTEDGSYVLVVWGADGCVTTPAATYAFTITSTALDHITNDPSAMTNKILRDGMLLIERDAKTYNVTGQEMK